MRSVMDKKVLWITFTILAIFFLSAQTCTVVSTGLAAKCEGEDDVVCNDDLEAWQCQVAQYTLGFYVTRAPVYDVDCGAEEAAGEEGGEETGTEEEDVDSDADGLTDKDEEEKYLTQPLVADTDGDGVSDGDEVNTNGTDPLDPDSDDDGLIDGREVGLGTDPLDSDTDDDGLDDVSEDSLGTDPLDSDTDDDGYFDGFEVNTTGTDPIDADMDDDGLTDYEEMDVYRTDPEDVDSDDDNYNDADEVSADTDPNDASDHPTTAMSTTKQLTTTVLSGYVSAYKATDITYVSIDVLLGDSFIYFWSYEQLSSGSTYAMGTFGGSQGIYTDIDSRNPTAASALLIGFSSLYWNGIDAERTVTVTTDVSTLEVVLPAVDEEALEDSLMIFYIASDGSTYYADQENDGVEMDKSDLLTAKEALTADHLARAAGTATSSRTSDSTKVVAKLGG